MSHPVIINEDKVGLGIIRYGFTNAGGHWDTGISLSMSSRCGSASGLPQAINELHLETPVPGKRV